MTFEEIDRLFRREISDEVGIGSDRRVEPWQSLAYAVDAEEEACRRARLLVDSSTTAICDISIVASTSVYPIDSRIITIRRAKLASQTKPLGKLPFWEMDERYPGWEIRTGIALALVTGMETRKIRLDRIPIATDTLNLTVVRLPLTPIARPADSPEIPAQYHRSLIFWMKHKAFNNQDSELFDKNRADVHLAHFEREFGVKSSAINEVFDETNLPYDNYDGGWR